MKRKLHLTHTSAYNFADMKRYFYIIIAAVVAVAACQKQPVEPQYSVKETDHGTYVFTINAFNEGIEPDVKSDYDSDGHFSWSAGDAISVLFHKGTENKFFTLTTTGTGASASFSGEIEDGYTIGASDGSSSDKKIWAFFPASDSHVYTEGSLPQFFVAPETDFTASHFSANLPMYDLLTEEGSLHFKNLCSGYKFTFSNIAASVNTVMVKVDNNAATYKFSGTLALVSEDGAYSIKPDWGDAGAARMQSYIASVDKVKNNVVVYIPTRRNTNYFQPVIDLLDYETGSTIVHLTAVDKKTSPAKGKVQPITIDTKNSAGTPPSFTSAFGIIWSDVTDSVTGSSGTKSIYNNAVRVFKAKADASYLYVYFEIDKEALLTNSSYDYANSIDVYLGNAESASSSWMWNESTKYTKHPFAAWLTKNGAAEVNSWEGVYAGSGKTGGHAETWGKVFAYEVKLNRSYDACMQIAGTINIGMVINNEKYHGGPSASDYLYVPSNGSAMLQITAPAYVAL